MSFAPSLALANRVRTQLSALRASPPTSLLLSGPPGSGKWTLARSFAQSCVCTNTVNQPCGRCEGCLQFENEHLELPNADRELITVAAASALRAEVYSRLVSASHLFVLVETIEYMHSAAANLLLKLLEEPPAKVHFVLTADSLLRVLPTLRSRSHLVRVGVPSSTDLLALPSVGALPDAALRIDAAEQRAGRLVTLLEDVAWQAHQTQVALCLTLARGSLLERFAIVSRVKDADAPALLDAVALQLGSALTKQTGPYATCPPAQVARALAATLRARTLLDRASRLSLVLENAFAQLP